MTVSQATNEPRFITTEELAVLLRRSESTVRYWRHLGLGPRGVRIGRRVLYARADVTAWLADQGMTDQA